MGNSCCRNSNIPLFETVISRTRARARARARAHKYAYLREYWEFFLSEKCVIFLSSIYVQISIANVIYDFFIPTMVCIFLFVAYGGVSRRAACTPLRHRAGTNRP